MLRNDPSVERNLCDEVTFSSVNSDLPPCVTKESKIQWSVVFIKSLVSRLGCKAPRPRKFKGSKARTTSPIWISSIGFSVPSDNKTCVPAAKQGLGTSPNCWITCLSTDLLKESTSDGSDGSTRSPPMSVIRKLALCTVPLAAEIALPAIPTAFPIEPSHFGAQADRSIPAIL
jgi:hypothetical protein